MRKLINTPNIGGVSSTYPDGVIVDKTISTPGTALTEILYGDLIQTVHKLKRLAGITENDQPDNETNGYQMLSAMVLQGLPKWQIPAAGIDFANVKFVVHNSAIYFHKTWINTNNSPATDTTNWAVLAYWNGTRLVLPDEARLTTIETGRTVTDLNAIEAPGFFRTTGTAANLPPWSSVTAVTGFEYWLNGSATERKQFVFDNTGRAGYRAQVGGVWAGWQLFASETYVGTSITDALALHVSDQSGDGTSAVAALSLAFRRSGRIVNVEGYVQTLGANATEALPEMLTSSLAANMLANGIPSPTAPVLFPMCGTDATGNAASRGYLATTGGSVRMWLTGHSEAGQKYYFNFNYLV